MDHIPWTKSYGPYDMDHIIWSVCHVFDLGLTFNLNLVTEIRLNDLLRFDNVAPGFICTIQVYGLDLPEKEKIKYLRHDAGFELWASLKLKQEDMTGKLQNRSLQIGQRAPRIPKLFGTIEMKLSGAIPVFCDIIKEGFLNMWTEEDGPQWKMLWVILKNGRLRGGKDPRFTSKTANFQIEITNGLKISESTRKRPNSFQLRDFSGRTILAASSKDEMTEWIKTIRKHKEYLKRLVIINQPKNVVNIILDGEG